MAENCISCGTKLQLDEGYVCVNCTDELDRTLMDDDTSEPMGGEA